MYQIKSRIWIEGKEGVLWGTVSAKHVGEFNDWDINGVPPSGKQVKWGEIWYFTVDGDKFGEDFELLHNHIQRFSSLGIKCIPDEMLQQ